MGYWIFKIADQELYPDIVGKEYVYDNTHSVKVQSGDVFLYLDKRNHDYSFSATGIVARVSQRPPTDTESRRTSKVQTIFTAHLKDVLWFTEPLSISLLKTEGRHNRAVLGIKDVNLLGWSQSMPQINESMYTAILNLADTEKIITLDSIKEKDYTVPDSWSKTKIRKAIAGFSDIVLSRHNSTCAVCGTRLSGMLEAAHISAYATDKKNRANPANGICLCVYCHKALDRKLIAISPEGEILISNMVNDKIALQHFSRIAAEQRKTWLKGIDKIFLELTVQFFHEANQ